MKYLTFLIILGITISSCKDKPVNPYENGFVGNWKMVSITTSLGAVTTNTTSAEIVTKFYPNSTHIEFDYNGSDGVGNYELGKGKKVSISVVRLDKGGWPNGPWLDLYLEVMNIAKSYKIDNDQLLIETADKWKILFTKL